MFGTESAAGPVTQEQGAQELVLRSRLGDQNAMAMIAKIAENAKKGDKRAQKSAVLIAAFIKANPVQRPNVGMASFNGDRSLDKVPSKALATLQSGQLGDPDLFKYLSTVCKYSNGPKMAVEILANTDKWNDDRVKEFGRAVIDNPDRAKVFVFGLKNPNHQDAPMAMAKKHPSNFFALAVGMLIGRARALQLVRYGNGSPAMLEPSMNGEF